MNPEDFKQAWKTQPLGIRVTIDADILEAETRRFQKQFAVTLFWRDVREVGTALVLIPVWLVLGKGLLLPWTWYLMVPALVWITGYMLVHRLRRRSQIAEATEPLCERLASALVEVEHQVHLLQNVFWWGLLPIAIPMLAFVGHVAWLTGSADWATALVVSLLFMFIGAVLYCVHRLNQIAVRMDLMPRREKLRIQLQSLQEVLAEDKPRMQG